MRDTAYHSVHGLPPGKGQAQHAQFLQALYSVKPELCYVNYQEAFQFLIARHPKRALTMVFTDFKKKMGEVGGSMPCSWAWSA